jgi:hypothetical protein
VVAGRGRRGAEQRAIERRIRDAKFHEEKNLSDFDWKFNAPAIDRTQIEQLATGEFVRRGENLVMVGQSGVGKSFLLQAIARRLCELGYPQTNFILAVRDVESSGLCVGSWASGAGAGRATREHGARRQGRPANSES